MVKRLGLTLLYLGDGFYCSRSAVTDRTREELKSRTVGIVKQRINLTVAGGYCAVVQYNSTVQSVVPCYCCCCSWYWSAATVVGLCAAIMCRRMPYRGRPSPSFMYCTTLYVRPTHVRDRTRASVSEQQDTTRAFFKAASPGDR